MFLDSAVPDDLSLMESPGKEHHRIIPEPALQGATPFPQNSGAPQPLPHKGCHPHCHQQALKDERGACEGKGNPHRHPCKMTSDDGEDEQALSSPPSPSASSSVQWG